MFNSFQAALKAACVAATLSVLASSGRAELPTKVYDEMKAKAPDFIEIEVTRVSINKRNGKDLRNISVYADANVVGVTRSTDNLKIGDKISLRYMTFEVITPGWAGPGPIMTVQKGKRYYAWLKKSGQHFYAAARGRSLENAD